MTVPNDLSTAVAGLASRLQGTLHQPGEDGYEAERAGFNLGFRHRPDVIVAAADAQDVVAAVAFAAEHDLPVIAQATGHGISVPMDGGVLVITRALDRVEVRKAARSAYIEAGVRWEQVALAADMYGLAPLSGSAMSVGAVSYTLGGGIGALSRQYGFASDHVRSIDVVTADAQLRHVTPQSDPDLFYALRGGRANFGIVTSMEIGLVPLRNFFGADYWYADDSATEILIAWRDWTETLPETLTSSISIIGMPDVDGVPGPLRGRRVVHVCVVFDGPKAEGEALIAPIRDIAPILMGSAEQLPFTKVGSVYKEPPFPHAYTGTNAMLTTLTDDAIAVGVGVTEPSAHVPCIIDIRHLGGALSRPAPVPGAVGQRSAQYVLRIVTPIEGHDLADVIEVYDRFYADVAGEAIGRSANFTYGIDPTPSQIESFYEPADYARLLELKAVYDPRNLFRLHQPLVRADAATSARH